MELLPTNILATGLQGAFYLFLLFFVLHTIVLSYHWFTYGTSRIISTTALAVYLLGGAFLFITLSVALTLI